MNLDGIKFFLVVLFFFFLCCYYTHRIWLEDVPYEIYSLRKTYNMCVHSSMQSTKKFIIFRDWNSIYPNLDSAISTNNEMKSFENTSTHTLTIILLTRAILSLSTLGTVTTTLSAITIQIWLYFGKIYKNTNHTKFLIIIINNILIRSVDFQ